MAAILLSNLQLCRNRFYIL